MARCLLLICSLMLLLYPSSVCRAATFDASDIIGVWEVEEGDGNIEIFRCNDKYCGSIAWLKEPVYPADDKGKMPGKPLLDRENPKKELRNRPLIGLRMMEGYTFRGNNLWDEGSIYNTENGKTYSSRISLKSRDRLELRGYIGIPLLGGSTVWKRVEKK
jgi:uncharacterized protein (DUF2147 family)